jgi:type IV secretory pathway VirB4 component
MAAGYRATLPLGEDPLGEEHLLPSAVVATLTPWVWEELQQPRGQLLGYKVRGGSPILIDTFDDSRFSNANIGIFGHSGAGKTYLMKSILLADADAGTSAFVVDPESEYRGLCEQLGGQWVDLSLGAGNSINVLDPALAAVGERDAIGDQVSDLLDLLATMCGAISDDDRADLDEVLRQELTRGGATLADVRQKLERGGLAPRTARNLRRWTEGPIGELFSRPTNVDFDSNLVVFGIRDLKEELLPVAYFLIAQWIWTVVRSHPRPRRILFDEVGLVFDSPVVRKFLVRLARRIRKYQGSLCVVTQNAGDLLASEHGLVLATNVATLFLGAQRPAEAQRLQRAYGLTESQAEKLSHAQRGEFLLLAGDSRHRMRVEVPPWHAAMLTAGVWQTS